MSLSCFGARTPETFAAERAAMVRAIAKMAAETHTYTGQDCFDARVMQAVAEVPRHAFVPDDLCAQAYANRPLPIGNAQTISQPYIVALMTDLARVGPDSVVLEIGTGSGYQSAVLARLVRQVYTVEVIAELARRAEQLLLGLGCQNVSVRAGDGYGGWPEHAPYDAILVTAAPEHLPAPLLAQLKPGGRLIVPVGAQHAPQSLQLISRDASGEISTRDVLPVGFVPMRPGEETIAGKSGVRS